MLYLLKPCIMKKILPYAIPIALCFLLGFIASYLQTDAINNWYPYLNKPALTPPNMAFPIAWSILYVCMSISIGLIYTNYPQWRKPFVWLFSIQLLFNFGWSIAFFYLQNPLLGMIDILILDVLVIWYAVKAYPVSKEASILFWPYIIWILFATYLNGYIWMYN